MAQGNLDILLRDHVEDTAIIRTPVADLTQRRIKGCRRFMRATNSYFTQNSAQSSFTFKTFFYRHASQSSRR
jgi:hypothetical protein